MRESPAQCGRVGSSAQGNLGLLNSCSHDWGNWSLTQSSSDLARVNPVCESAL